MERTAPAEEPAPWAPSGVPLASAGATPSAPPLPEVSGLLDRVPRQRTGTTRGGRGPVGDGVRAGVDDGTRTVVEDAVPARAHGGVTASVADVTTSAADDARTPGEYGETASGLGCVPATPAAGSAVPGAVPRVLGRLRALRPWRLLPTPTGTPFTFGYAAVLVATSLFAVYANTALVYALQQGSSTDVAHLVRTPVLVLPASALWIAGGVTSPYAIGFLLVLTALERRIGGLRTAGVFLLGHVLATLATEVPVGLAVLAGHLPYSSLHRLDYGISFGVAACVGALSGLLTPWLRGPLLAVFGGMLLEDLLRFTDPMTNWGHLIALGIGLATWPVVRRRHRALTRCAATVS